MKKERKNMNINVNNLGESSNANLSFHWKFLALLSLVSKMLIDCIRDLVFSAIFMPVQHGFTFLKILKENKNGVTLVLMFARLKAFCLSVWVQ